MLLSRALCSALVVSLVSAGLAIGCGGTVGPLKGPVVAAGSPETATPPGTADDATWMTLAPQGARMRIPSGWSWARKGQALVARSGDKKAAIVFLGATTKQELDAQVRAIGDEFKTDQVDFTKGRPGKLHGIDVVMYEDMAAANAGTPADVFVMLGDAPNGHGVLMVFVMAWDATQAHDPAIIEAANSLQPM